MDPKFIPIYLTVESVEFVIAALRKFPHEQVHELVIDIATQVSNQEKTPAEAEVLEAN